MAKLNLDSFNAILMQALKDQGPKGQLDLLMHELQMAYGVKIEYMEKVIDDLNSCRPYHQNLKYVNNVDGACEKLDRQINELYEKYPELKEGEENEQNDSI